MNTGEGIRPHLGSMFEPLPLGTLIHRPVAPGPDDDTAAQKGTENHQKNVIFESPGTETSSGRDVSSGTHTKTGIDRSSGTGTSSGRGVSSGTHTKKGIDRSPGTGIVSDGEIASFLLFGETKPTGSPIATKEVLHEREPYPLPEGVLSGGVHRQNGGSSDRQSQDGTGSFGSEVLSSPGNSGQVHQKASDRSKKKNGNFGSTTKEKKREDPPRSDEGSVPDRGERKDHAQRIPSRGRIPAPSDSTESVVKRGQGTSGESEMPIYSKERPNGNIRSTSSSEYSPGDRERTGDLEKRSVMYPTPPPHPPMSQLQGERPSMKKTPFPLLHEQGTGSTTIRVSIGRIDVRAVTEPAPQTRPQKPTAPRLSLDDYLRMRAGGRV
jgi:hypothetical protein